MANQYWYETPDSGEKHGRIVRLSASAHTLVTQVLELKPGEEVTIVTDTEVSPLLYYSIAGAVKAAGGVASVVVIEPRDYPGADVPRAAYHALQSCDYIVSCTSRSITFSQAIQDAYLRNGIKYTVMSNATEDMLMRGAATADVEVVRDISLKTRDALNRGSQIHVTSPGGTDVTFDTSGRRFHAYYSKFDDGKTAAVFPGGEVNTTPNEDSGTGRIVIDSFMMEIGSVREPIVWELEQGRIVRIEGGAEARQLEALVEERGDEFSRFIGELSVGTNYKARRVGSALEDKQVYGDVHVALGSGVNAPDGSYKVRYRSKLHLDGVMARPTLTVDGETVVADGEILVAPRPKG